MKENGSHVRALSLSRWEGSEAAEAFGRDEPSEPAPATGVEKHTAQSGARYLSPQLDFVGDA